MQQQKGMSQSTGYKFPQKQKVKLALRSTHRECYLLGIVVVILCPVWQCINEQHANTFCWNICDRHIFRLPSKSEKRKRKCSRSAAFSFWRSLSHMRQFFPLLFSPSIHSSFFETLIHRLNLIQLLTSIGQGQELKQVFRKMFSRHFLFLWFYRHKNYTVLRLKSKPDLVLTEIIPNNTVWRQWVFILNHECSSDQKWPHLFLTV